MNPDSSNRPFVRRLPAPLIGTLRHLRDRWIGWRYHRDGMPWTINDLAVRVTPETRLRMGPLYDPPVAAHLARQMRPGQLVVNVGANLGVYVLQAAAWTAPDGRIIAFEPNPEARALLRRHLEMNRVEDRVVVEEAAVGGASGRATFWRSGSDGMSRLAGPNPRLDGAPTHSDEVDVVTLDDYWRDAERAPDWLIMDIEGFEPAALAGARALIQGTPGLSLVVEMHPDSWHLCDYDLDRTERLLAELGLRPVPLTGQRDPLRDHGMVELRRVG